jgi:hypothetical protein
MTSREQIERALAAHGIIDSVRVESHLRGCDLNQPVSARLLRQGDSIGVWVRDQGTPGKYAAPLGEYPLRLGIMIEERHLETYVVTGELTVLRCTAATFPPGLIDRIGGAGGGIQYILPPEWLSKVERTK